jgi:hypothetical protein
MVTVSNYRVSTNKENKKFYSLILTGEIEFIQSKETGNFYATAKETSITSTFTEEVCKSLVGKQMPGSIQKVKAPKYSYTIKETGEVISLDYRYVYVPEGQTLEDQKRESPFVQEEELVH